MITYKEQFDKLTRAYINNEVNPFTSCACFVGNLLNNNHIWQYARGIQYGTFSKNLENVMYASLGILHESGGTYETSEIIHLEAVFMKVISDKGYFSKIQIDNLDDPTEYENTLFEAFETTLEELKKIHISKGENVDEELIFKKRELVNA